MSVTKQIATKDDVLAEARSGAKIQTKDQIENRICMTQSGCNSVNSSCAFLVNFLPKHGWRYIANHMFLRFIISCDLYALPKVFG